MHLSPPEPAAAGLLLVTTLLVRIVAPLVILTVPDQAWRSGCTYRRGTVLLGRLTAVAYFWGVFAGHFADLWGADDICGGHPSAPLTQRLLPLVSTCHLVG